MNPLKVIFVIFGLIYAGLLVWGLGGKLPHVPTIGALGIFWCSLGWYITDKTLS